MEDYITYFFCLWLLNFFIGIEVHADVAIMPGKRLLANDPNYLHQLELKLQVCISSVNNLDVGKL